jgi:bifunctional ADP-heptose synthase (sugar kinase/adenylyltransferase)
VGYDIVKAKGGKVMTIQLVDGFSTTKLIEKMKS